MTALTLVVPLLLAVTAAKPTATQSTKTQTTKTQTAKVQTAKVRPAPTAEPQAELTEEDKTLAEVALARKLPKWVGPAHRKQLRRVVALLRAGDLPGAVEAWESLVKGSAEQRNQSEFDFVARWAVRQAYLADKKELDKVAYRLGRVLRLEGELDVYETELRAVQIKGATKQRVFVRAVGASALGPKKAVHLDRTGLSNAIKELESLQETVRNKRQMASTAFQNFDQKANQMYNLLSAVMKAMNEMRMATIRNML